VNFPHKPGRRVLRALLLAPAVLLVTLILPASQAAAHSLDAYLQATYLTVTPSTITVELDLSPGVLIAPGVLTVLDGNGDHQVTDAEARSYLEQFLQNVELRVDDQSQPLTLTKVDVPPYRTIQAGYGTLRAFATTPTTAPAATGSHRIFFRNGSADDTAAYQVNAFVAKGAPIVLGTQDRSSTQQQATISYWVDASAAATRQSSVDQERSTAERSGLGLFSSRFLVQAVLAPILAGGAGLLVLGLLLVRWRTLLPRMTRIPAPWNPFLPLLGAVLVTTLSAGLILKAIGT
jgi:nickel/cobalt exporter